MKGYLERVLPMVRDPRRMVNRLFTTSIFKCIPDSLYLKLVFRFKIGHRLDLKSPKTFNEKMQWLKLYDRNPLYSRLVDKYEVREYIENTIGGKYLIPLIGVYDSFDDIDFNELPNRFVLKCTHDSGGVVICSDKSNFDLKAAKKRLNKCLRKNYYWSWREWPYKSIRPRIICEELLIEESGNELLDYKFMSFNGNVKCSFVCLNRKSPTGLNVDFYDMEWNPMPFERHYPSSGKKIAKPKNFDKMVKLAEKLSKGMPFIRVDFYEVNGRVYFGELTLYPGSGFEEFTPDSYDELLGNWISLPLKNKFKGEN
ncbi:ATP-grasp fold amidoligase family protein [Schinkia azotoformans]|uniref:ATP-grasp fold amidoligase family protein n=1 Tax=Schinkia azotoformans TaxID=1454 RepID=UPI002DB639A6|nr:ATP-grasp fold amidoligase family protein [Schinkia azotoformans]MEC1760392.1 ATP-grasp fold amidoligase family protein [Schinkia azotoformans]